MSESAITMQHSMNLKRALQRYSQLIMLVIVLVISVAMTGGTFFRPSSLLVVLASASVFGLLSLGQGLVVISGGFDLAVGSLISFAISLIVTLKPLIGLVPTTVIALVATTLLGLVSGAMISKTRIPPFIVTLGMMSIVSSLAWILIMGQYIKLKDYHDAILPLFAWIPMGVNLFPIVALLIVALAMAVLVHRTNFGRYVYGIGSNEKAAIASGIKVVRTKIIVYGISAFLCGIGAIVFLYHYTTATPGTGEEYLLLTFASTMIGGVYMYGGEGTVGGVLIGILILATLKHVLTVAGVPPTMHAAILGGIVLGVVLLQRWLKANW
jgi:ribose/xylose/arabinose/galactoside ABC-type transport system permease subunit